VRVQCNNWRQIHLKTSGFRMLSTMKTSRTTRVVRRQPKAILGETEACLLDKAHIKEVYAEVGVYTADTVIIVRHSLSVLQFTSLLSCICPRSL
jgi:hypothetical protein